MRLTARGVFSLSGIMLMGVLSLGGCSQQTANFPSKSITVVVPWDAGGGTDALARSIALQTSKELSQGVHVLNRSGGAGAIGHSFGATARPDGYTVTMITYELCTYAPLGRVQLTPLDYKPLIQLNEDPAAITVHADSPWQTLREFIDYAREHPEAVTIGNSGPGAVWHIGALKLETLAAVRFTHVPHNGAKPAVTQLLGNHLDAVSVSPAEVLSYLKMGSLRCLGVMSEERLLELPNVPTCREGGYDLVHGTWRGLAVPPETPDSLVSILENGFKRGYDSPEFQETARKALLGLRYRNAQEFSAYLDKELKSVTALFSGSDLVIQSGADVHRIPRFYAVLFVIFGAIVGLQAYRKSPLSQTETESASESSVQKMPLIALLLLILYAVLMFTIGYILSSLLYLSIMMLLLGERRPLFIGIVSVGIVFAIYGIFQSILDVPIPGFWG